MKNINIKAVTQLTGLNENTLRAWERRYNALDPQRDKDGRRVYNQKDIEKLNLLSKLVQQGHLIGNIATLSIQELKTIYEGLSTLIDTKEPEADLAASQIEQKHLNKIINSLKKFDLSQIQSSLQNARFELSPKAIINGLVLPLMREVGSLVAESKLRISQEHLLSSLLRDHLGQLYQSLSPYDYQDKTKAKRIILTTREGDLHEFGILVAAILCRINGHETYYLGPNMPSEDLAEACSDFKIDLLILGLAAIPKQKEIVTTDQFLKDLDQLTPKKVKFLCGGSNNFNTSVIKSNRQLIRFSTLVELDQYLQRPI